MLGPIPPCVQPPSPYTVLYCQNNPSTPAAATAAEGCSKVRKKSRKAGSTVIRQIVMTVVVARQDKSCQQNYVVMVNPFLA